MKRHVLGLSETARDSHSEVPDGIFLVRLDHAQHRWQVQKPFYTIRLSIVEPKLFAGRSLVSRLHCTPKAMWKLGWFLRDFLYDPRTVESGRGRACSARAGQSREDQPHGGERHLARELRRLRSGQPVGRAGRHNACFADRQL